MLDGITQQLLHRPLLLVHELLIGLLLIGFQAHQRPVERPPVFL